MNKTTLTLTLLIFTSILVACGGSTSSSTNTGTTTEPTTTPTTGTGQSTNYALFSVHGNQAHMSGDINSDIVDQLNAMLADNPQVDTIVMVDVPGSLDDEANLKAALIVREKQLTTMIPERGSVASGGTDFFLAGSVRIVGDGALIGVHSWADGEGNQGADLPNTDASHQLYLDYYASIGIDSDFYWYTLNAAPADNIHWMTQDEVLRYNVATRAMTDNEQANVIAVPEQFDQAIKDLFDRYTWLKAPNGKVVNIFAQTEVSTAQLLRARNTLSFYLTDTASQSKTAIFNSMGEKSASLFIFKNQAASEQAFNSSLGSTSFAQSGQDLYATEIFVEGDSRYLASTPDGRDATMEEVLHLTQAYGIAPALTQLQTDIAAQAEVALTANTWNPEAEQLAEWRAEGNAATGSSVSHEYFAAIVEAYFGMWQNFDSGMDGYTGNSRTLQLQQDPAGQALVTGFLPLMITTMMNIDATFGEGQTFSMTYDASKSYTSKSQYLLSARLTGSHNANISGNASDNLLMGNRGNNQIDGKEGRDTYRVNGLKSEFNLIESEQGLLLEDTISNRNGSDILNNIEQIAFSDITHPIN